MNNEKTPEQIEEESRQARAAAETDAIERGALPAEQPPRLVHGNPDAPVEDVPPATLPPIDPIDTGAGTEADPPAVVDEADAGEIEQIDGRADIVTDGAALTDADAAADLAGEPRPTSDTIPGEETQEAFIERTDAERETQAPPSGDQG